MKIRTRIFLVFALTLGGGTIGLVSWIQDEMRPRYMEAQEDPLVDTAQLLASLIERLGLKQVEGAARPDPDFLRQAFSGVTGKPVSARIYALHKDKVDVRVYVTDPEGTVVFDSDDGRDEGKDYARWRDVHLTAQGQYGARSTHGDPLFPSGSTMYIAAPIRHGGEIVGTVSIGKPTRNVERFMNSSYRDLQYAALLVVLVAGLFAFILYRWVSRPLQQMLDYAKAVHAGERVPHPRLGRNEMGRVADAMAEMRTALDGKRYIADYVQSLTHELKSPTAAIRGAAELLEEEMPTHQRRRFIRNIRNESRRLQEIIDRLLELAAIENRPALEQPREIHLASLIDEAVESLHPLAAAKEITVHTLCEPDITLPCDPFLIHQALANLLKNALEFSPPRGEVTIHAQRTGQEMEISVLDHGPGVPDYAKDKVFDRFFSLPSADGRKGTGLGLSFVREIAALHGGRVALESGAEAGTEAKLILASPLR